MKTIALLIISGIYIGFNIAYAQSDSKKEMIRVESNMAKSAFLEKDSGMADFFKSSYGYIILPNVGKGAWGLGIAAGNGVAYEQGEFIGYSKLSQVSIGFQAGGQAYREVVFFESEEAMQRFKDNRIEISAQVSAVAAASGASANAKYIEGVAVFTMAKGGLMYEASVGGQKFKYNPE